jgi:hydrogenase maturation protease
MESRKPSRKRPRILIAGLGNCLLKDDGIGVHVVRELRKNFSVARLAVEVGTAVLDALHLFEWADTILAIDAMQAGGPPGTLYSFGVTDIAEPGQHVSLHELSFLGALEFLPKGHTPRITILGVEPETIDYGLDLSPTLQAVLPGVISEVKGRVTQWNRRIKTTSDCAGINGACSRGVTP